MTLSDYDYHLPKELIANEPASPRDSSRLLVCDTATGRVSYDMFANCAAYLPERSILVLNDTKVVPARLELTKPSGVAVRILFLVNEWDRGSLIRGLPDRNINSGDVLYLNGQAVAEAVSHHNEEFTLRLLVDAAAFDELCAKAGRTPLPPYIRKHSAEPLIRSAYQSIFAARPASVAAPTASLHFTDEVFASLDARGVERAYVTLHVGRGTFSPVSDEVMRHGRLHAEPVSVPEETARLIAAAKREGRTIAAVGTTVSRALESAAADVLGGRTYEGETTLMIAPAYEFRVVDALFTNFHLPKTSLLLLLDAFLRHKKSPHSWRDLYKMAIKEQFRFYSFGDAMLIV